MARMNHVAAALLVAATTVGIAAPARTAGARFELRGYVPAICSANVQSFDVSTGAHLAVDAIIHQSCNSTHRMSVRYEGLGVVDPGDLSISYGGRSPIRVTPFSADFSEEGFVREARPMHLVWAKGTDEQQRMLASTITIVVTPR